MGGIKPIKKTGQCGKVNTLLNEKLNNIEWGEFKLGDLFEFKAIKQAKSQKNIPTDNSENGVPYKRLDRYYKVSI